MDARNGGLVLLAFRVELQLTRAQRGTGLLQFAAQRGPLGFQFREAAGELLLQRSAMAANGMVDRMISALNLDFSFITVPRT